MATSYKIISINEPALLEINFNALEDKIRRALLDDIDLSIVLSASEKKIADSCNVLQYIIRNGPFRTVSAKHYQICSEQCPCQSVLTDL